MSIYAQFPEWRSRRLRRTEAIRRLVAETQISVNDFVAPLFVREDIEEPQQIPSLVSRNPKTSLDQKPGIQME